LQGFGSVGYLQPSFEHSGDGGAGRGGTTELFSANIMARLPVYYLKNRAWLFSLQFQHVEFDYCHPSVVLYQ
jgi:hypothetical protein